MFPGILTCAALALVTASGIFDEIKNSRLVNYLKEVDRIASQQKIETDKMWQEARDDNRRISENLAQKAAKSRRTIIIDESKSIITPVRRDKKIIAGFATYIFRNADGVTSLYEQPVLINDSI